MNWRNEWKALLLVAAVFLACFWLPVGVPRFDTAILEALHLTKWYAQEHVILCLIPAFFIAGAIAAFVSQASVMRYLGAQANKVLAYSVASVSGTILAVCFCTVLPLFAGIYRRGPCRDRLAAFIHWHDRGSLAQAVAVAHEQPIDMKRLRKWFREVGRGELFREFERELSARNDENR